MAATPSLALDLCKQIEEKYSVNLVESTKFSLINRKQCMILFRKLLDTQETLVTIQHKLSDSEFTSSQSSDVGPVIRGLIHVLKRVHVIFFKDCFCKDKWLEAALRQGGDLKETFGEIVSDLQWDRSVLHSIQVGQDSQDLAPVDCDRNLSGIDLEALSAAAKSDQEDLKGFLRELKGEPARSGENGGYISMQCLATQLLDKLEFQPWSSTALEKYDEGLHEGGRNKCSEWPLVLAINMQDLRKGPLLGEGSFGSVHETDWLGETYAMKIPKQGHCTQILELEIKALAGLQHPHVIRLVGCAEEEGKLSYLMEHMDKSLSKMLEDCPLPLVERVDIWLQIAKGVRYLHSKNVVHRDLKPENILVRRDDSGPESLMLAPLVEHFWIAKVSDFGTAKEKMESMAYAGQTTNVGTTMFMAPEMYEPEHGAKQPERFHPMKTDVYSFALICFVVLTSESMPFPFKELMNPTIKAFKDRVRKGKRPELPPNCPVYLSDLIQQCWDGNPVKRPNFDYICTELRRIKDFLLTGCSQLKELPTSIDKLTTLQLLDLSWCLELKEFPTSIHKLIALESLYLSRCSQLKELPTSIDKLITLRLLDLSGRSELKELPTSIDKLIAFNSLDLSGCSELKELPTFIDKLTALQLLDLSGCSELKELLLASAFNPHAPDVKGSDEGSSSIDFELGGNVGVGTLQSQATSKFAEHCTVLKITEVHDKVITSAQQLLDSENGGNSIKVVGRQDKTAYEFFFQSAKCMSKVVGVGLEWAKVVVCKKFGSVEVFISETAWQDSWHQVEEGVVVLSIDLTNIRKEGRNIYRLTTEEASKKFGVGVHPQGCDYNHGGVKAFFVEEKQKDVAFYPLIWELAHYMAWNCKQYAGSESRNSGARSLWGMLGPTTSSQSKGSSSNNQVGDDVVDNSGALANLCDIFSNVAIDPKKDKTLIVTVYLPKEYIFNPQNMAKSQLDDRIKFASISAALEFKFELLQSDASRKITIETRTHCNLGDSAPKSRARGYLGYYQDDITISLSCLGNKGDGSEAANLLSPLTAPISKYETRSKCDTYSECDTYGYVLISLEQEASWKCNFLSEHNVLDYVKQGDDGAYKRLKNSGIFNTFWPSIVSLWGNLDDKHEACPYEFKVKREIISIQDEIKCQSIQAIRDHAQTPSFVPTPEPKLRHSWRFWSKKKTLAASQDFLVPEISTESQNLQQVYTKTMWVNIAMTHVIHEYKQLELHGQENKPDTGITIRVQGPPQVNAETA